MCSRDILFFVNTFVFTYDPRLLPGIPEIPFITYEYQDVAFDRIKTAIEEGYDQLTEKSRDMGATWMYLIVFMPLSQRPGEAQVDFGHALANFGGTLKKIVFFVMSLAHSDAMFVNLPRSCCSASVR